MSNYKKIISFVMAVAIVLGAVNVTAFALTPSATTYSKYFSTERAFFSKYDEFEAEPIVPDSYHFIHGVSETAATNDLEQSVIESLVPGYLYTKNWKTGEVELILATELTSYSLTESNTLYAASKGGKICEYALDGTKKAEVLDMSSTEGEVRNLTANDELLVFTMDGVAYRFYMPSKTLDCLGRISESDPKYFWAPSNNTIEWYADTNTTDPHDASYVIYQKNIATGKLSIVDDRKDDCAADYEASEVASTTATSYFSDSGAKCRCHGQKLGDQVFNCDTTQTDGDALAANCDCRTGSWAGVVGMQCQGYAYDWYSKNVSKTKDGQTKLGSVSFVGLTSSAKLARLYDLLDDCCYGANMRVNNDGHSLIMLSPASTTALKITDANWYPGKCIIRTTNYTPTNFVNTFTSITNVWTQGHDFQRSGNSMVCTLCNRSVLVS